MAKSGSLHDAFVDELRDVYHAEHQILKVLPKMIKKARAGDLRETLASHLDATKAQVDRLEQVFATVSEKVRGKRCEGMAGIISEGKSVMREHFDEQAMDACLVAAAQRVEQYEVAAYGTLILWARTLGHLEAAALLATNLEEEKAAYGTLSSLAESGLTALVSAADGASEQLNNASTKGAKKARKGKKAARQ